MGRTKQFQQFLLLVSFSIPFYSGSSLLLVQGLYKEFKLRLYHGKGERQKMIIGQLDPLTWFRLSLLLSLFWQRFVSRTRNKIYSKMVLKCVSTSTSIYFEISARENFIILFPKMRLRVCRYLASTS